MRATIVVGLVVAVLVVAFVLAGAPSGGTGQLEVRIHDADGRVQTMSLSEDARLTVSTAAGSNTVVVEEGQARIAEADCPNGDCLRQHAISQPGQQLICLPHRLWVEVAPSDAPDGHMDEHAVTSDDAAPDVDAVAR